MGTKYGAWEIERSLPEGGQAHTFLVHNLKTREKAVLKRLKNLARIERFRTERDALAALESPYVPRLLDENLEGDKPYLVFECVLGSDLEHFVKESTDSIAVLQVLLETCTVLAHVHQNGICHRDLKPCHILVENGHLSGIIDFGLVFYEGHKRVTLLDEAVGSFMYIAPELEDGSGEVTPAVDVYAFGKLIYFALSGGKQFSREKHRDDMYNLVSLRSDPRFERINELLDRMICRSPADRFQNASEAKAPLVKILQYFRSVTMERHLTIHEGELRHHSDHWHEIGDGVFSNADHEGQDWSIFGPYTIEPPLEQGFYQASFKLRCQKTGGNPSGAHLTIDVAASVDEAIGASVISARSLGPRDLTVASNTPESWRIHSLLFPYLGEENIEFRVLKDNPPGSGVTMGKYTIEFGGVILRQLSMGLNQL